MTDVEVLREVLHQGGLTDREEEAFQSMLDLLEQNEGRTLTDPQRSWARSVAMAKGIVTEETQNLWSAGKVPRGFETQKSRGELKAVEVLKNRPTRPPGRSA